MRESEIQNLFRWGSCTEKGLINFTEVLNLPFLFSANKVKFANALLGGKTYQERIFFHSVRIW